MANVNDPNGPESAYVPVVQNEKKSRGCLYGCLFVFVAGLALMLCAGIGGYWFVTGQVEKYTSTTPVELPTVEFEEAQLAELEARVESFTEAFEKDTTPAEDLVLTAEEINALIAKEEKMRGRVFISIEEGQVSGDVSIPTDAIPGGKGRYFNGSARFDVAMDSGVLIVTLVDAEVNGEVLPPQFIEAMAKENLAKDLYKDADTARALQKIESVSVEGDKIILKVKRDGPQPDADESEPDAAESEADAGETSGDDAGDANDTPDGEGTESAELELAPAGSAGDE